MNKSNCRNQEAMVLNLARRIEALEKLSMFQKQHMLELAQALNELSSNLEQLTEALANSVKESTSPP